MLFHEVIVLDSAKCFVRYVHPALARKLIRDKKATVYCKNPFVIQVEDSASIINLQYKENT